MSILLAKLFSSVSPCSGYCGRTVSILLVALIASAQPVPDRPGARYEPAQTSISLKLDTDIQRGSFTIRVLQEAPDLFMVTLSTRDDKANHAIITVFYRASAVMDGGRVALLLSRTVATPLLGKYMVVGSDPFPIPWSSVEFIRVVAAHETDRQEFR